MKAKWTTSRNACRVLPVIAVTLILTCISCAKDSSEDITDEVTSQDGSVFTKYFKVHPSGTNIQAFDGDVILDFPPGAVSTSSDYKIESFPLDGLDLKGENVMMRAFTLTNVNGSYAVVEK